MVRNAIKVYARLKQPNDISLEKRYDIIKKPDCQELVFRPDGTQNFGFYKNYPNIKFKFTEIFERNTTQSSVFDSMTKPVVNSLMEGYNGTIFAYGQTGSGKTYSITGNQKDECAKGIIPRTIQHIFENLKNNPAAANPKIYISYIEIYNETAYDLLNTSTRATNLEELPRVSLLEDSQGGVHLRNLNVVSVTTEQEAMKFLHMGDHNRKISETPMNPQSSRSHCIFTVQFVTLAEGGELKKSKLHLVDLAGSERIHKSGISGNILTEAININLSLHYLEHVIISLSEEKRTHIPYRNSIMTSVLKDSLGGNCLTVMLATLSIEPTNFEETISTCKFAQRVAMISTDASINLTVDPQEEIAFLRMEIENLQNQLAMQKGQTPFRQTQGDMSIEEIETCKDSVKQFLNGASADVITTTLDIRVIQMCFKLIRQMIPTQIKAPKENEKLDSIDTNDESYYKSIIKQKDKEMSILLEKLNKEKCKNIDNSLSSSLAVFFNSEDGRQPEYSVPLYQPEKEALKLFMNEPENRAEIEKFTSVIKQNYSKGKIICKRVEMCKQNITNLKKKIEDNKMYKSDDLVRLNALLDNQQEIYKDSVAHLQKLKDETENLKMKLDRTKIRLQEKFKERKQIKKANTQKHQTLHYIDQDDDEEESEEEEVITSKEERMLLMYNKYGKHNVPEHDVPPYAKYPRQNDCNERNDYYNINQHNPINNNICSLPYQNKYYSQQTGYQDPSSLNYSSYPQNKIFPAYTYVPNNVNTHNICRQQYSNDSQLPNNKPIINTQAMHSTAINEYKHEQIYTTSLPYNNDPMAEYHHNNNLYAQQQYKAHQYYNKELALQQQMSNPVVNVVERPQKLTHNLTYAPPVLQNKLPINSFGVNHETNNEHIYAMNKIKHEQEETMMNQHGNYIKQDFPIGTNVHVPIDTGLSLQHNGGIQTSNLLTTGEIQIRRRNNNATEIINEQQRNLLDVPLTGDPDVDEEIMKFYKARNSVCK